jgi:hypothetical protein
VLRVLVCVNLFTCQTLTAIFLHTHPSVHPPPFRFCVSSLRVCLPLQLRDHLGELCKSPPQTSGQCADRDALRDVDVMEQRVKPLIKGALRHALLCTASCLQRQHADTTGSGSARQMGLLEHGEKGGRKLEAGAHRYGFKLLAADFILDEHLDVYLLSFCENFELDLPQSKVVSSLNVVTVHMQLVSCACGCQRPVGRPTDVPTAVLRDFLHVLLQLLLCAS